MVFQMPKSPNVVWAAFLLGPDQRYSVCMFCAYYVITKEVQDLPVNTWIQDWPEPPALVDGPSEPHPDHFIK